MTVAAIAVEVQVAALTSFGVIGAALVAAIASLIRSNTTQHDQAITKLDDVKTIIDKGLREVRGEVRELVGQVGELRGETHVRHSDHVAQIDQIDADLRALTERDDARHEDNVRRLDAIEDVARDLAGRVSALEPGGA